MKKIRYPQLHDKEWLFNQYVSLRKSMCRIAEEVGTSPCVVFDAIKKHGIESRGKGELKKGVPHTFEHSMKISMALKGKEKPWMAGETNGNWQGGRTQAIQMGRSTLRYKYWKDTIF